MRISEVCLDFEILPWPVPVVGMVGVNFGLDYQTTFL